VGVSPRVWAPLGKKKKNGLALARVTLKGEAGGRPKNSENTFGKEGEVAAKYRGVNLTQ